MDEHLLPVPAPLPWVVEFGRYIAELRQKYGVNPRPSTGKSPETVEHDSMGTTADEQPRRPPLTPEERGDSIRELVALLRKGHKAYLESLDNSTDDDSTED